MGDREFTYANWMEAVRAGNTFVTVGPLAAMTVDGVAPGGQLHLPVGGGTVDVTWKVESAMLPIEQVEIVVGGFTAEQVSVGGKWRRKAARHPHRRFDVDRAACVAATAASRKRWPHTRAQCRYWRATRRSSADGRGARPGADRGAIAYVDTLKQQGPTRCASSSCATLEVAYNRLHQRMHNAGIYHQHTPLHAHDHPHEHQAAARGFMPIQKGAGLATRPFLVHQSAGLPAPKMYYRTRTFTAEGPLGPCSTENSTRWPSTRLRKPGRRRWRSGGRIRPCRPQLPRSRSPSDR